MRQSFISPRKKQLLKTDTKLWLTFIVVSMTIMYGFVFFMIYKVNTLKEDAATTLVAKNETSKKALQMKHEYEILKSNLAFSMEIKNENKQLNEGLRNIFEIVPDQIVLTKLEVSNNCLTISGISPSKDLFNFQFSPALKSIFTTSTTTFQQKAKGWISFVSVNKLEKTELEEKAEAKAEEHKTEEAKKVEAPHHGH